jgi:hypothetical protein
MFGNVMASVVGISGTKLSSTIYTLQIQSGIGTDRETSALVQTKENKSEAVKIVLIQLK